VADVKQSIQQGLAPELKPATVARNTKLGHAASADTPLVLSGILHDAIESRVRNG
jgi:hypothetical protein